MWQKLERTSETFSQIHTNFFKIFLWYLDGLALSKISLAKSVICSFNQIHEQEGSVIYDLFTVNLTSFNYLIIYALLFFIVSSWFILFLKRLWLTICTYFTYYSKSMFIQMFISMNPLQAFLAYSIPIDVDSEDQNSIETKFIISI